MRLNREQQKLVEENHNLIYQYLIDKQLPQDEYYDIAAIGLCKAAMNYSVDAGYTFATYVYKSITNTIKNEAIKVKRHTVQAYSANNECMIGDDGDEFINLFADNNVDVEGKISAINHFEWFMEYMSNRQLQICIGKLYNMTDAEIGKLFGVSHSSISQMWRVIKKAYASGKRPYNNIMIQNVKNVDMKEHKRLKQKVLDILNEVV